MKFLLVIFLACYCTTTSAQMLTSKFDTKNHPKAKGLWVTVKYPAGWKAAEGERPNIVQTFTGDYKDLFVVLSLQIRNLGVPVEQECRETGVVEFAKAFSDKASNLVIANVRKLTHEEKPAFFYEMQTRIARAGLLINTTAEVMMVCYKSTLISAWCSPSQIDYSRKALTANQRELQVARPLCLEYFNSLVLMDKY